MGLIIKCTSTDNIYCPCCGSQNIISIHSPTTSHCGKCGINVAVEVVAKIYVPKEPEMEKFEQMSLF